MLTITIGRASLTLDDLVITGSRETTPSGIWIPADGMGLPRFAPRYTHAPDSAYVPGKQLLAVVLDQGDLPLRVRLGAGSAAELATRRSQLEEALSQFSFPLTIDVDGATQTWSADFTWPQWQVQSAADRASFRSTAVVTIPVNPPGAP